ncbi:MAG: urocanate hydratase, partial [Candidatus Tectomicrobia bacterium]
IIIEVDMERMQRRLDTCYLDTWTRDFDAALTQAETAKRDGKALSIGLLGNAAEIVPAMVQRGFIPDLVTDQTSAHDPLLGYIPPAPADDNLAATRHRDPDGYKAQVLEAMAGHCHAIVDMQKQGAIAFDYGNNLRAMARAGGFADAFAYPGFVPAFIRDQFCEGRGPFRWVALSGNPEDIYKTDHALMALFPDHDGLHRWLTEGVKTLPVQGLPARICWLGYNERHQAGLLFNDMVKRGDLEAPIVIGRDHLDSGSVASPYRETEAMRDTSDAVADWPLLNFALNAVSGAGWVSFHHGGGVGLGYSLHAGQVCVADGSDDAAARLARVLINDPGTGVMRHADAGYDQAIAVAKTHGVDLPSLA